MSEVTTTLGALLSAEPALLRLADLRLPAKTAYHLAKLCRLIAAEVKLFYEARDKVIKELGTEREPTPEEALRNGGEPVTEVNPENRAEFFKRVQELALVDVTLPWGPLPLAALDSIELSADEVNALGNLLEVPL